MPKLFDKDSDSDVELNTNTDYAKSYDTWRKKEELHKLQARYGDDVISSSESSTDDEGDEQPDMNFDKDFFRTLSYLKTKDSRIYDRNFDFFERPPNVEPNLKRKNKEQPMYIKDYERKLLLEKGGQLSDEDDDPKLTNTVSYADEQNELKQNLKNVLDNIVDHEDENENWGGLFKTREKTVEETQKEDSEYFQWLAGQTQNLNNAAVENQLKPLKDFWGNPKLEDGEKFLRDYILKKRFLEEECEDYIPTYDEIVHDSDKDFSEDEKAIDQQEEFEHKYNFRFEDPDQDFIKRYPRTMENSLRTKDEKRKVKRLERKERKIEEKKQKIEDINKLKALKKMEIEEKINKLKEITGDGEIAFDVKDFEDDFDPDEHDRRMQNLFNEEFYQGPEGEQKPEFPDIDEELELENWDHWHGNEEDNETLSEFRKELHCEDDNFNMDCDYDPAKSQQELINNTKRKKKRKRKSKFAEVLSKPKPVFNPHDRTYQEYLDEYYKLDCEDIIGDVPCRFKYRKVIPNDFGLTVEEILSAKDKELNRWCSLKKAVQYRPEHVEKYDVIAFAKKGKNIDLKRKYIPSLFESTLEQTNESTSKTTNPTELIKKAEPSKTSLVNDTEDTGIKSNPINGKVASEFSIKKKKPKISEKKDLKESNASYNSKTNVEGNVDILISHIKANNIQEQTITSSKQKKINKLKPTKEDIPNPKKCQSDIYLSGSQDLDDKNEVNIHQKTKKQKYKTVNHTKVLWNVKNLKQKEDNDKKRKNLEQDIGISDARLAAYGFKPKKFKNKIKYRKI